LSSVQFLRSEKKKKKKKKKKNEKKKKKTIRALAGDEDKVIVGEDVADFEGFVFAEETGFGDDQQIVEEKQLPLCLV
jgi:hypothetical protein